LIEHSVRVVCRLHQALIGRVTQRSECWRRGGARRRVTRPRRRAVSRELRGFALMDPERQREIAAKGGRAAHEKGTAHEWSKEQARIAGRKGGLAPHHSNGARRKLHV